MAGDPLADCTQIRIDCSNTYSTTSPSEITVNWTGISYRTIVYNIRQDLGELEKKIKELLKKRVIQDMKEEWNDFKKEFRPIPRIRPSTQLRGVSFGGRGWA